VKPAIREIFQYVINHPEMTTRAGVDLYFDQILWSMEKQEWMKLTDQEQQQFSDQLELQNGRHQKEPGRGDNNPSKWGLFISISEYLPEISRLEYFLLHRGFL